MRQYNHRRMRQTLQLCNFQLCSKCCHHRFCRFLIFDTLCFGFVGHFGLFQQYSHCRWPAIIPLVSYLCAVQPMWHARARHSLIIAAFSSEISNTVQVQVLLWSCLDCFLFLRACLVIAVNGASVEVLYNDSPACKLLLSCVPGYRG